MALFLRRRVLPGFAPTLGFTLFYLSLIVLVPLAGVFVKASGLGLDGLLHTLGSPRVLASLKLSFSTAFVAALVNGVFGLLTAWALERYSFPGRRLLDAMVDLPFALPTAVAGIALTALYAVVTQAVAHRELDPRTLWRAMADCAQIVGGVMLILGMALGLCTYGWHFRCREFVDVAAPLPSQANGTQVR